MPSQEQVFGDLLKLFHIGDRTDISTALLQVELLAKCQSNGLHGDVGRFGSKYLLDTGLSLQRVRFPDDVFCRVHGFDDRTLLVVLF